MTYTCRRLILCPLKQALPNWLAEMQITNLDVSFCKACKLDVISQMTSLTVLSLQVRVFICVSGLSSSLIP